MLDRWATKCSEISEKYSEATANRFPEIYTNLFLGRERRLETRNCLEFGKTINRSKKEEMEGWRGKRRMRNDVPWLAKRSIAASISFVARNQIFSKVPAHTTANAIYGGIERSIWWITRVKTDKMKKIVDPSKSNRSWQTMQVTGDWRKWKWNWQFTKENWWKNEIENFATNKSKKDLIFYCF